ncbi:uncharacterized protein AMSG_09635 [Thecamonas trahens ATCC 50062]|uniref:Small ribosomal subunit protein mS33 n=1 Tax=Thecamonas trahens ATCC 50062 TaxID=461836 RepID=A0A0L0DPN6_THETB|nr:hypothetical protein AMSG_09635 [Thecamonas trahens ATCC 50062]KNC53986.1 hypothetical protein AMSG_09635 [Thecamonas trahens ATCC 50062]|eukprot:XP_013754188.1 hypothetical protein AMSG_09635 [Thecamonas trahens ATCC 50062]
MASRAARSVPELVAVSRAIFGTVEGNGLRSGRKVLRKALVADKMLNYYMPILSHAFPGYMDEIRSRRKAKAAELSRSGRGAPKKGAGKRKGGKKK